MAGDHTPPTDANLYRALGRMEGKLDALITTSAAQAGKVSDLDKRLGIVERFQSKVTGIVVGASAFVSASITVAVKYLTIGGTP